MLASPAIIWWLLVGRREINYGKKKRRIELGNEVPPGISFYGSAVVVKQEGRINAFEAKCTHLGCRINEADGDSLICPCHGSRFDLSGKAVKGPAVNSLKELNILKDPRTGEYYIETFKV
jgi:Rieske Fe-S protein